MSVTLDQKLASLPDKPGIYQLKNRHKDIIYIGKARNLKKRVRSYFQPRDLLDPKTTVLVSHVDDLDWIVTDTEVEALILEANLVRKHQPRYNINLKDDKRYPHIKITAEPYPRLLVVRRPQNDGGRYFGPYTSVKSMRKTLNFLAKVFQIRDCTPALPRKACINLQMHRCLGPCIDRVSRAEYLSNVNGLILFLEGKNKDLLAQLRARMLRHSKEQNYEAAAQMKRMIEDIEKTLIRQKMDLNDSLDMDIVNYAAVENKYCFVTFQIREGLLVGRHHYFVSGSTAEDTPQVLSAFLKQYYIDSTVLPSEVLIPQSVEDEAVLTLWLSQKAGHTVQILHIPKEKKSQLLKLAGQNAKLLLDEKLVSAQNMSGQTLTLLQQVKQDLSLKKIPLRIEGYDISNIQGRDAVGAMVCFVNGKPEKSQYRHFKIKTVSGMNDFAMLQEILTRRLKRIRQESSPAPDLILIDGGKGQLSAAVEILERYSLALGIVGLAKRLEEIYFPDRSNPLLLSTGSPTLQLLQRVRNEVHRFALSYHRKLRQNHYKTSQLDGIGKLGPVRKRRLLQKFGTVADIKKASAEELMQVLGIQPLLARNIYKTLHTPSA